MKMTDREKIKRYLRNEMKKVVGFEFRKIEKKDLKDSKFAFCWGQAKFDTLMDIDRTLELGAFYKTSCNSSSSTRK